ncbi:hypothetical protein Hanom_Chr11g01029161 [Helianthus anomalus]
MFVELISPLYVSCIFVDLGFLHIFQICKEKVMVIKGKPDDDGGLLPGMATSVAIVALLSGFIDDDDLF